jgi:hypothetical protein
VTLFHQKRTPETDDQVAWNGSITISRVTRYSPQPHYGGGSAPNQDIWDSWYRDHPDVHASFAGLVWHVTTFERVLAEAVKRQPRNNDVAVLLVRRDSRNCHSIFSLADAWRRNSRSTGWQLNTAAVIIGILKQ